MSPNKLLKSFVLVSAIGFIAVLSLVTLGTGHILDEYNLQIANREASSIAHALILKDPDALVDPTTNQMYTRVPPARFEEFDARLRRVLSPLDIIKIKIFTRDGEIMYCTDHKLIGEVDLDNPQLTRALRGEIDSGHRKKGSIADLMNEIRLDIDVIESYVPIVTARDEVIGAYEVYRDVTPYQIQIASTVQIHLWMVFSLLLILFSVLVLLMWRLTRMLLDTHHKLEYQANRDPLTGLLNIGYLKNRLAEEWGRYKRAVTGGTKYHLGVILIDLDFFKSINDQFGHLAGDGVLVAVADRLQNALRLHDIVGRYGGEEFLVILPEATPEESRRLAHRIWESVREAPVRLENNEHFVTASLGVACFDRLDQSIEDVLLRADKALYKAKRAGRDGIELAS